MISAVNTISTVLNIVNSLPSGDSLGPGSTFEEQMSVIQDYLCGDLHDNSSTSANPILILGHLLQPNPATGPGNNNNDNDNNIVVVIISLCVWIKFVKQVAG